MELCDPKTVRHLLSRHNFRFSRSMGQNFLIDKRVPDVIAQAASLDESAGVLEIGPGIGALTVRLAPLAGRLVAVELDRSLAPILDETLADLNNVELIFGDILKLDIRGIVSEKLPGLRPAVCANLPYNITSPVITALIESGLFRVMVLLVQREVAQRICGGPEGDYGAFTVYVNYYYTSEILLTVPPESFMPAPKVHSSVIRLVRRSSPAQELVSDEEFFRVVRAAFALRRKKLVNSMFSVLGNEFTKEELLDAVVSCGYPEDIRGEALDINGFSQIALKLSKKSR
ncbi:MAG: 16S rRNA (adenine(1518)-N(6)/adenine(1519)-N(6))-dimethyltransferase RsmA [Oscillospiraceae bacterium]